MRLFHTLSLIAALAWSGAASATSSINPSVPATNSPLSSGPVRSNFNAAYNDVNGIENCFSGLSAPGNPSTFQLWCDTTGAPTSVKVKQFDGAQWVVTGVLNTTTHVFLPAGSGGLPITSTPNIFTVVQTVDLGSGASEPTIGTGGALAVYSADGVAVRYEATEFNNSVSGAYAIFDGRTSLGTRVSPTTVTNGTTLASFEGKGYDSSVWTGTGGALHVYAQGTWTTSSHPGQACLAATPTGGITTVNNLCVNSDGSASLVGALTVPTVIGVTGGPLTLESPTGQSIFFNAGGVNETTINTTTFGPITDNSLTLGSVTNRWSNIYGVVATVPTINGGSAAGSSLTLNGTSSGSPSGDAINLNASNVFVKPAGGGGGSAILNIGVPAGSGGSVVIASPTANAMTLVPAASATGTATIPSGSYNLVGDTTTQTLTNKTWNGVAVGISYGGTGQTTASAAIAALMPATTRAGDLAYFNGTVWTDFSGNNSGTQTLQENSSGVPVWATVAGTGTVQSVTITASGGGVTSGTCPTAITNTGTCNIAAPGGFLNVLRNNSMTAWFHGFGPITITTAGGWCAEGVWVLPTGASVTCQQIANPSNNAPFYAVKITGAASVTDVVVRFVVESLQAQLLSSKNATFQLNWVNNTGGTVTPLLQTKYPATQDSWGSPTIDLAATNLQACTNGSQCTEAYTLAVSNVAIQGYEFNVDLGNNFSTSGKTATLIYFDARLTPGVSTGLNANPPPFEMRDPSADIAWNERFYQTTYDNGVATATATHVGIVGTTGATSSNAGQMGNVFRTTMRCDPSVSFWDGAGNASKLSFWNGAAWTDNQAVAPVVLSPGHHGFTFYNNLAGTNEAFHYAADCTISGG